MKVFLGDKKDELAVFAKDAIEKIFTEHHNKHILFLTSGGSSFKLLDLLESLPCYISIGVLDERYSTDNEVNNFSQLVETQFYIRSEKLFEQIFNTTVQVGESLESFSCRFEALIRKWKSQFPEGIVVVTLGMGEDGHISGIMPFPENDVVFEGLFNDPRNWIVGYDAGNKNKYRYRVTTTLSFLRNEVDFAIAYITGEEKKHALGMFLADEGKISSIPARVMHEMKNVILFTNIETE